MAIISLTLCISILAVCTVFNLHICEKMKKRPICDNNEQSGLKYQGKRGQAKTLKGSKSKG